MTRLPLAAALAALTFAACGGGSAPSSGYTPPSVPQSTGAAGSGGGAAASAGAAGPAEPAPDAPDAPDEPDDWGALGGV